jgi:tRNA G46 methylase TrmB
MTYFKLTTGTGPVYRSFDSDNFITVELFNGTIHKRMAKIENEALYNHMVTKTTNENFVETTEEEFTLNKIEILAILNKV